MHVDGFLALLGYFHLQTPEFQLAFGNQLVNRFILHQKYLPLQFMFCHRQGNPFQD
ncbi:hypothetical protein DSECCO2_541410 [anaerobic digester metagenome]